MRPISVGSALLVGLLASPGSGAAQNHELPTVPASGLVASEDALLAAIFIGSLASIEIEGFDELDGLIAASPERGGDTHRSFGRAFGRIEIGLGLSGLTYLAGAATGSETTSRVGLRGLETLAVTAGLTTILKVGVGRSRPDSGVEEDQFRPLSFEHSRWSFPSGHTSNMFALATTLSLELEDEAPWVPYVAYPIAGWTGISRVLDEKHWLTDVVAGAAVGIFSARLVHRLHRDASQADGAAPGSGPRLLLSRAGEEVLVGLSLSLN